MSVSRDLFDLRIGGLYLPSLVLIVIQPAIPILPLIVFGGLLAAVFFHGMIRAVFGIGGPEENPMKRSDVIQGMQVALSGKGPHNKLPDTFPRMILELLFNPRRYGLQLMFLAVIGLISLVAWILAVVLSLFYGISQLDQLNVVAQLLIFAELVWVLQWALWRFFTRFHLLEEGDFE